MKDEKGIALLLVLWIITLLTVICAEFSWTMRTETTIVRNFKEGEQAYYTAEAGINKAFVELMRFLNKPKTTIKEAESEEEEELPLLMPGSEPFQFFLGDHRCDITVQDESNKISINAFLARAKKNPGKLKQLLGQKLGLEGEQRDIVADSMIDWWDKDHNITGINGTEDDYYRSLDDPYECKDGQLNVIEELLLIRGIDEKIFYGDQGAPQKTITMTSEQLQSILSEGQEPLQEDVEIEEESIEGEPKINLGLVNIFTMHSNARDFKINLNTASLNQLLLLEGMDNSTAKEIIDARQEREFVRKDPRLPTFENYQLWAKDITVKDARRGRFYTIEAKGFAGNGPVSRTIQCTAMVTKNRFHILNWKDLM
jgi:type II secretory pathway component PulK